MKRILLAASAALVLNASAQQAEIMYAALGEFSRPIQTDSHEAQAWFDQGIQMMYAFAKDEAPASFEEAARRDSTCAACWWAVSWSYGPYLNGRMRESDNQPAYEAAQRALMLRENAAPVERALIDAMAVRYAPEWDSDDRARLDTLFANAMSDVVARFPDDLDAGTLYGEALMLLEPRRGRWSIDDPDVIHIHQVLERVLEADITHPGACHLYIHATESTTEPGKAEACAEYLGDAIPGASHINHMPSHTFNRIGRWGDAVRGNIQAWHSDQKAAYNQGFAIYPSHNLHMLLFAASMDGQGAVAVQAGRDYAKIVSGGQFYEALALLRFGRFDEILEMVDTPENPTFRGLWDFARGYAHLKVGDPDNARVYVERLDRAIREHPDAGFRGHPLPDLLGITGGILKAGIARHEGDLDAAIEMLEAAVIVEDSLRYDEPEPLNFSARHWLGDVLLDADRPEDAEAVFRAALEDHPKNGWSLLGLHQALEAQGNMEEAAVVAQQLESAWARSDTWIQRAVF
ncbi:MAG: tetratricopeptide repeat protein [Rhodothermales bacterium]|nr:tetratricopeptide repeat protein [Rhodothermales bacterium]MBO6779226.1 tetratricopeptide repeat protein [Rhodothermales bacterium]